MQSGQKSMASLFFSVVSLIIGLIATTISTIFLIKFAITDINSKLAMRDGFFFASSYPMYFAVILAGVAFLISYMQKSNRSFSVILLAIWATLAAIFLLFRQSMPIAPLIYSIF